MVGAEEIRSTHCTGLIRVIATRTHYSQPESIRRRRTWVLGIAQLPEPSLNASNKRQAVRFVLMSTSRVRSTIVPRWVVEVVRPFYHRINPWTGLNGLDKRLVKYLPSVSGVFVEAGANDGLKQSNTYYLERRRGWKGLLIEPIPRLAERCRQQRPRSLVVNAALVPPQLDGTMISLIDVDLMSIVSMAQETGLAHDEHVAAGEQVQGVKRKNVSVRGRTLSNLIDEARLPHVDLLSLDVEGFELQALAGLDLSRHQPCWILVETDKPDEVGNLLGDTYEQVAQLSFHDWLFRRAGEH